MNTTKPQKQGIDHDQIAKAAWQIWLNEGCQPGRDQEYWLKAEQQLLATKQQGHSQANVAIVKRTDPSAREKNSLRA